MGEPICVWILGILCFAGLEVYFGVNALQNLAPGVARKDVGFSRKFAGQVNKGLFNEIGQQYRARMMYNEVAASFWILVVGLVAISS
jgi:hypothetical protein